MVIKILLAILFVIALMLTFGSAMKKDLKELEKTDPKLRKYYKDKFDI